MTNLVQEARYTKDGPFPSAFTTGTIGSPSHSLQDSSDPSPTFLEMWSRAAGVESWYWRYTPKPYVAGSRTLGVVDFAADPGTDFGTTKQLVFSRANANLVGLQFAANDEPFASGTAASSSSGTDGNGIAYWSDISTITKYGVLDDQTLAVTAPSFSEQRHNSSLIVGNKVSLGNSVSKSALLLRDPATADAWRELDKVMIDDKEMNVNQLVSRIIGYTFDEGVPTQSVILDQFGADFLVAARTSHKGGRGANPSPPARIGMKRLQQALWQVANKFANR